jgi:hypothetical protein
MDLHAFDKRAKRKRLGPIMGAVVVVGLLAVAWGQAHAAGPMPLPVIQRGK